MASPPDHDWPPLTVTPAGAEGGWRDDMGVCVSACAGLGCRPDCGRRSHLVLISVFGAQFLNLGTIDILERRIL